MKTLFIILGIILVLTGLLYVWGALLPEKHQSSVTAELAASPEEVWAVITDYKKYEQWRTGVEYVTVTDNRHWAETSEDGTLHFEVVDVQPHEKLVTRIINEDLPFGGSWTYSLTPSGTGTVLTLTENGEVYNPLFRFLSRFVFGHDTTLKKYIDDLKKELHQE